MRIQYGRGSTNLLQHRVHIGLKLRQRIGRINLKLAQIFKARQDDIHAMSIRSQLTGGVQQRLRELVVGCKTNFEIRVKQLAPKCNDGPQRLRCERRGDGKSEGRISFVDSHALIQYSIWRYLQTRSRYRMGGTLLP